MPGRGRNRRTQARANLPVVQDDNESAKGRKLSESSQSVESGIEILSLDDSITSEKPNEVKLPMGTTIIARKPTEPAKVFRPGTGPKEFDSNTIVLETNKSIVLYEYQVIVDKPGRNKPIEISKGSVDDFRRFKNREKCYQILKALFVKYPTVFPKDAVFCYDRARYLISDHKIPALDGEKLVKFDVEIYDFDTENREKWNVKCSGTNSQGIKLNELSAMIDPDLSKRNYEPKKMLEVITSKHLYDQWNDNGNVFVTGNKSYDSSKWQKIHGAGCVYLLPGFLKTAQVVNYKGQPRLAINIDYKNRAFYSPVSIEKFILEEIPKFNFNSPTIWMLDQLHEKLKGKTMELESYDGESRSFKCVGLMAGYRKSTIMTLQPQIKGSVFEYFKKTYPQVQIKFKNLPGLRNQQNSIFPIEVCRIARYQAIQTAQMNPKLQQQMIRDSTKGGAFERQKRIKEMILEYEITSNETLTQLGMQLEDTIVVGGRLLPMPKMKMNKQLTVTNKGEFRFDNGGGFLVGGNCARMGFLVVQPNNLEKFPLIKAQQWFDDFRKKAMEMGVKLTESKYYKQQVENVEELKTEFMKMQSLNVEFVVTILPDFSREFYHREIKCMELETQIITQNVLRKTVERMNERGGDKILYNFLAKTNVKLGGIDFEVSFGGPSQFVARWFNCDVMYIAMDVNHLSLGSQVNEPSIVGMVTNAGPSSFSMVGEHYIIPPRTENQDINTMLDYYVQELTDRWIRVRKQAPKFVHFLRDGVSMGQFEHILSTEVPLIERGIRSSVVKFYGDYNYDLKLNVTICTKLHNQRFFPKNLSKENNVNVAPGTLIEDMHPTYFEFYMAAHDSPQGTTRLPKFTVLKNDCCMSKDELYNCMHLLCYGHQCVSKPVSMPHFLFGAHNMAKRGKMLWKGLESSSEASDSILRDDQYFKTMSAIISIGNKQKLKHRNHNQ